MMSKQRFCIRGYDKCMLTGMPALLAMHLVWISVQAQQSSQARVQAAHVYGVKVDVWNAQAPHKVLACSIVMYGMACIHVQQHFATAVPRGHRQIRSLDKPR